MVKPSVVGVKIPAKVEALLQVYPLRALQPLITTAAFGAKGGLGGE